LKQVAVIGAGGAEEDSEAWRLAEEVGKLLAEAGATREISLSSAPARW
jgi:predicted Rossmann-fold nucleotide-binding protein